MTPITVIVILLGGLLLAPLVIARSFSEDPIFLKRLKLAIEELSWRLQHYLQWRGSSLNEIKKEGGASREAILDRIGEVERLLADQNNNLLSTHKILARLERRLDKNEENHSVKAQIDLQKKKIETLEQELQTNRAIAHELAEDLAFADSSSKTQISIALSRHMLGQAETVIQNAVKKCDTRDIWSFIEKMEKKIDKRWETAITESNRVHQAKRSRLQDAVQSIEARIEQLEKKAAEYQSKIDEARAAQAAITESTPVSRINLRKIRVESTSGLRKIEAFMQRIDPSVERAFKRLLDHHETAKQLSQLPRSEELQLEQEIKGWKEEATDLKAKIDRVNQEGSFPEGTVTTLEDRRAGVIETSTNLSAVLLNLKRRNLSINQKLFEIQQTIHRLFMLKLMIAAIPQTLENQIAQFLRLAELAGQELTDLQKKEEATSDAPASTDLTQRIDLLHEDVLMKFLSIAKQEEKPISPKENLSLQQSITDIAKQLQELRGSQGTESSHWENIANAALEAGSDSTHAIASLRQDQCAQTNVSIDRSLEVLATVSLKLKKDSQA